MYLYTNDTRVFFFILTTAVITYLLLYCVRDRAVLPATSRTTFCLLAPHAYTFLSNVKKEKENRRQTVGRRIVSASTRRRRRIHNAAVGPGRRRRSIRWRGEPGERGARRILCGIIIRTCGGRRPARTSYE